MGVALERLGTLKTHTSREIEASKLSIGFECLDREMWDDPEEAYDLVGDLGVKWARIQSGWERCERRKGYYDFIWLDRIVNKLRERGIQPWMCLCYSNTLYVEEGRAVLPRHPEAMAAWERYVASVIRHFADRIWQYEIWNEPSFHYTAMEYAALVKATARQIRTIQPGAKIAAGSAPYDGIDGDDFLAACLKDGMGEWMDAYTYHGYSSRPEIHSVERRDVLRAILKSFGCERVELWQGECGCPSARSDHQALRGLPWTEERQAKITLRRVMTDLMLNVDLSSYFAFSDYNFYISGGQKEFYTAHFGLIRQNPVMPKPSYFALRNLCTLFDARTSRVHDMLVEMDNDSRKENTHRAMGAQSQRSSFLDYNLVCRRVAFRRSGAPLAVWWYPSDVLPELSGRPAFKEFPINLWLWSPQAVELDDPVVIDLLTGDVFRPTTVERNSIYDSDNGYVKLAYVPMRDYPLVVTDRRVIELKC